jgi:hypothetical protein
MGDMKKSLPLSVTHEVTYLHTYLLTPWSRDLLQKLTGFAANQEIPPHFMELESSLPYSQAPAYLVCEYYITFCSFTGRIC